MILFGPTGSDQFRGSGVCQIHRDGCFFIHSFVIIGPEVIGARRAKRRILTQNTQNTCNKNTALWLWNVATLSPNTNCPAHNMYNRTHDTGATQFKDVMETRLQILSDNGRFWSVYVSFPKYPLHGTVSFIGSFWFKIRCFSGEWSTFNYLLWPQALNSHTCLMEKICFKNTFILSERRGWYWSIWIWILSFYCRTVSPGLVQVLMFSGPRESDCDSF